MVPIFEYQYMYIHLGPSDMSVVLLYVCVYAYMIKTSYRAVHACKLIDFVYVVKRRANV